MPFLRLTEEVGFIEMEAVTKVGSATARLRLDDVLDALTSEDGREIVSSVRKSFEEGGMEFGSAVRVRTDPTTGKPLFRPADAFEAAMVKPMTGGLRGIQGSAAIPGFLVSYFSHAAGKDGTISAKDIEDVLGPRAGSMVAQVAAILDEGKRTLPTTRRKSKYRWMPSLIAQQVAASSTPPKLEKRMPLLAEVSRLLGGPNKLTGLQMISVQHLFPTTEPLFEELKKNGLDASKTIIHGKNYSTNEDTLFRMRANGWDAPTFALIALPFERNTAGDYLRTIVQDLDPKDSGKPPKALLLDEGGKLLSALHRDFPEYAHLFVAVEQTEHGIQVIEDMKKEGIELKCPVVSVARSGAKKIHESPMIGESVAHSIEMGLRDLNPELGIDPKEATIIGYGAVGKATADALKRRGFKIFVHDVDPKKMEQAAEDGCVTGSREKMLSHAHLLVSATGRTTITPDEFDRLLPNRAVLVNAGSGNHELGMNQFKDRPVRLTDPKETVDTEGWLRSTFQGKPVRLGDQAAEEQTASQIMRTESGSERLVLRGGYVVNMVEDIPPEFIQLTRSLLLAGCLQAVDCAGQPGVVDLDRQVQDFIVARTKRHLSAQHLRLEAPDFRKLAPAES